MSLQVVAEVRALFPPGGLSPEQGVRICHTVAQRLRERTGDQSWGVHRKPGGNNWGGYATDIVGHRASGVLYDILGDVEGSGRPQWGTAPGTLDWAPPDPALVAGGVQPGPVDPGPGPGPVDPGPVDPGAIAAVLAKLDQIAANQVQTAVAVQAGLAEIKKAVTDGVKIKF